MDINIPSQIVVQTAAQWAADATVYSDKRILITSNVFYGATDQRKFKIADGVKTWANLNYFPVSGFDDATSSVQGQLNNKEPILGYTPENVLNKNQNSGYAGLSSAGKVALSTLPLDIDGTLSANLDTLIATQKAVKTYADTKQAAGTYATGTGTANGTNTGDETAARIGAIVNAATDYPTPLNADKIGIWDVANSLFKSVTWANIKATLKTYFDTLYPPASGWVPDSNTWTYSSVDGSTGIVSINADMTGILSVGMRLRFTNTTSKYFIVTVVGAFSAGATLITMNGGTDYALVNASITVPFYSAAKIPFGFPASPSKWEVLVLDSTEYTIPNPTAGVWNNNAGHLITIPIGSWRLRGTGEAVQRGGTGDLWFTISSANNTVGEERFTTRFRTSGATGDFGAQFSFDEPIETATKITMYLNVKINSASVTQIYMPSSGDMCTELRLQSAYL